MNPLSKELESLGFRLSLGLTEVDEHLTEQEIQTLETIAVRFAGRRSRHITQNERTSNHGS